MTGARLNPNDLIIGVDTHKDNHVAFAINSVGNSLGECTIPATQSGYEQLLNWTMGLGNPISFGVEGTGSYGKGLTRFLQRQGMPVVEVSRPARRDERRRSEKDDVLDAEQAARQVLSGQATAIPKTSNGAVEMIRLVKIARDTALKAQTQALVTLKSILVTASEDLRSLLEPLSASEMIATCANFSVEPIGTPTSAMRHSLRSLARRWLHLHEEIEIHSQHLETLTRESAPQLVQAYGIGTNTAAEMLLAFGDNSHRVRSEAAFALDVWGLSPSRLFW